MNAYSPTTSTKTTNDNRFKYVKRIVIALVAFFVMIYAWYKVDVYLEVDAKIGTTIDELHGVKVYYNGSISHVSGRNVAPDGYNIGLKYQCVEFIKRYYYERFNHKMRDAYGHAKSFFDTNVRDGELNKRRMLLQFSNGSRSQPQVEDIIVFDGTSHNPYGHIAIISKVGTNFIEIIQQNSGRHGDTRETFTLTQIDLRWTVNNHRVLGWLRIPPQAMLTVSNKLQG